VVLLGKKESDTLERIGYFCERPAILPECQFPPPELLALYSIMKRTAGHSSPSQGLRFNRTPL